MLTTGSREGVLDFTNQLGAQIDSFVYSAKSYLNIRTFGYRRFLADGMSFGFSTHELWNKIFLENFNDNLVIDYETALRAYITSGRSIFIRTGLPVQNNEYQQTLYGLDIWKALLQYG